MKNLILSLAVLSICHVIFSQDDPIYYNNRKEATKNSQNIPAKNIRDTLYKGYNDTLYKNLPKDKVSLGVGLGMDFGGIGGNILIYPQKNIGVFAGAGYILAGMGYNIGIKLRTTEGSINFFATGMYGYNAVIKVENASEYDKIFYGPTLGFGIDIHPRKPYRRNYLTLALLVPLRKQEVDDYIDDLKKYNNVEFKNDLIPIAFSIGYRIVIQ